MKTPWWHFTVIHEERTVLRSTEKLDLLRNWVAGAVQLLVLAPGLEGRFAGQDEVDFERSWDRYDRPEVL